MRFDPRHKLASKDPIPRGVEVVNDSATVAAESEKGVSAWAIDNRLRPLFGERWSVATERPLFHLVSVETQSGCNYSCHFCGVARTVDPRPPGQMSWLNINKIADELGEIDYDGRVALFGNNEPLLDSRIVDIVRTFRKRVPAADIRLLTNGALLNPDLAVALFRAGLDCLVVNNYTDGVRLTRRVRDLIAVSERFASYDLRISVRERDEILTSRAGTAPNKPQPAGPARGFCALPFTDLHVSYTGDVNLCCFDAHNRSSLGSLATQDLLQIWNSAAFTAHRERLLLGDRSGFPLCAACDFDGFRSPTRSDPPMIRADLVGLDE
ncbi:radical SAM/SPASM domain-containing protein [Solirubrobacter deserti]|uniref:SPASM domain-containing protein n=1 Tax=Solirubrobacter deserti TaxID=2282478 RepID=A0ABT4RQV7_9ACTN|nr:radical SAM/SPASM domain-containing protein [Solirubrobacter deserti]MDA0140924.1 SPASM domain-containing protein [Solirubrobacter deserti]